MGCPIVVVVAGLCVLPQNSSGSYSNSDFAEEVREKIFLEGTVGINDTTTGCWFLRTDDGRQFEPIFCTYEPIELKQGLRIRVYGYVEPDAPQTCALGPVFYAEQIQIAVGTDISNYSGLAKLDRFPNILSRLR